MVKHAALHGEIDEKFLELLIDILESTDGPIEIFFWSNGGYVITAKCMIYLLNQHKERVTLIGHTELCSSAFDVFYGFKGKRKLVTGTMGMYHYGYKQITMSHNRKPVYSHDEAYMENVDYGRVPAQNTAKKIMTKAELKKFEDNHDIFFTFERMKQIFPDAEVI